MTSPTDPRAKIAARIAACLALAERETTPLGEREAAAAKAAELIARHGITADQAAAARGDAPEGITCAPVALLNTDGHGEARADLANDVARAMGCRAILKPTRAPRPYTVIVVGTTSDVHHLRQLLPLILAQAQTAAANTDPEKRRARDFLSSFLSGYGDIVAARITARRRPLTDPATNPGAALILADRAKRIDDFIAERFGELNERTHQASQDGKTAGRAAARRADIGDPGVKATSRRALPT
ncbi:Protein of unknown function [Micromonospora nigra]|uniref:DUF2786 domain-containing protein n=1 Tax=Micromonospora nigra TaxID=145857 RepID=A0A1C6R7B4_9ACTN|nr:DUF2786 domain-containing protein [Micromonospora nigra]SCL12921.1 Protein of unknown function [Micromonospora nigra]